MSFLSKTDLSNILPTCITPYDADLLESANYQLTLSNSYYLNPSDKEKVVFLDEKDPHLVIKPGQFALVITTETVKVPANYIALLSVKAGVKYRGLVNVSGFHVDPGFEGKLKFSLFNAGPNNIVLEVGKPYFLIWFCQLTAAVASEDLYNGGHQNQSRISGDDVMKLQGDLASPNLLLERIKKMEGVKAHLDWVVKILLAAVVAIGVRSLWVQHTSAKAEQALIERSSAEHFEKAFESLGLDSIAKSRFEKIDSIIERMNNDYQLVGQKLQDQRKKK